MIAGAKELKLLKKGIQPNIHTLMLIFDEKFYLPLKIVEKNVSVCPNFTSRLMEARVSYSAAI